MNNYLKGNDMWPYVTMWEYEERIIPLRKIVDIFHESWKLIQPLGKLIFINRQKIRKNMLSSLVFLTYRD